MLGSYSFKRKTFRLDPIFKKLKNLKDTSEGERRDLVNQTLVDLIQKEAQPCFLLSEVLDFVERIDREGILPHYTFSSFELWLNQSHLSHDEQLRIRGKIVGKFVDRSDYQVFFPIGMGKTFEGTHFVTAHKSPDLDTTIASFWGWVDAFGSRVSNGLHVWNLPGGPPSSQIEIQWIFEDIFGKGVFTHLPKTRSSLAVTSKDLMTKSGMVLKKLEDTITGAEHEREQQAIVVTDDAGFFLGDWRSFDVEEVRQVIILLSTCLRWFENHLHLHLITLFAKETLKITEIQHVLDLFSMPLEKCDPFQEFSYRQRKEMDRFLSKVLEVKEGFHVTFEELWKKVSHLTKLPSVSGDLLSKSIKTLFDKKGNLIENRPKIFAFLQVVVKELHVAIVEIRQRLEQLDIAMKAKQEVFGHHPTFVTMDSDVEEIRQKMGSHVSLTVANPSDGKLFPVGIVPASVLRKSILGTVSLRDFCNREEMGIPAYLDIISVIDHHKTQLHTFAPPFAVISDAQSSNTLVARQAFELNDQYSLGGQTPESLKEQIKELKGTFSPRSNRILQRLLKKQNLAAKKNDFFISVAREYTEYLHFLYGILDDTDLLSKVSVLDVECVASLLNRLKSLMTGREEEIITLDDIPKDKNFPKKAAIRILQNEEMYSLYNKVYAHREKEVAENIVLARAGKPSQFFADTKVQNGCCRVGQTKLFARNMALFAPASEDIASFWLENAARINKEQPQIDLFIHMISTVTSADEVYEGKVVEYAHKDEMWLWVPDQEVAIEHLKRFLTAFQLSPGLKNNPLEVELVGPRAKEFQTYFKTSFLEVPIKVKKGKESLVIVRYKAGSLNSRKAMISPFLPSI